MGGDCERRVAAGDRVCGVQDVPHGRGGGASAGDNTDELSIDAVAPISDFLIINKAGDEDGRFTTIANEKNIPLVSVEKNLELLERLKKIFTK